MNLQRRQESSDLVVEEDPMEIYVIETRAGYSFKNFVKKI